MSIKIRSLTQRYEATKPPIFKSFACEFEKGKIYAILGKSGSGKTTLLNCIAGMVDCQIDIDKDTLSYVFQSDALIEDITVKNNVKLVIAQNSKDKTEKDKTAEKFLKLVEIDSYSDRYPDKLSGGERKRVSIARALAHEHDTLLLDEPFSSLDYGIKKRVMSCVVETGKRQEKTVIMATHDVDEALFAADEIYLLSGSPAKLELLATIDEPQENRDIYGERYGKIKKEIIERLSK